MADNLTCANVLHWNYRGFTRFPIEILSEDETVTDIYLKENLISNLPADIGKLVHLESLYLSGNDITELPREISRLRCLKCLDVSGNRLRHIPDEIGDVRGLKFLILDENELKELPLRLAELRQLRYLSVCDNKLEWLPQKPVYNYHHCEFRFWRNKSLQSIPYSLWYHMFKGQQTRSFNIGCFNNIQKPSNITAHKSNYRCRLKLYKDSRELTLDVECPQFNVIMESKKASPPSLSELCRRLLYQILSETANRLSKDRRMFSYDDNLYNYENSLEQGFGDINIENNNLNYDFNGNNLSPSTWKPATVKDKSRTKDYFSVIDVIDDFYFLPKFLKQCICNGPASRCEYVGCKRPVFDYAIQEFCVGEIILIDNVEEITLSATFCSKLCSDLWKRHKNVIEWELL